LYEQSKKATRINQDGRALYFDRQKISAWSRSSHQYLASEATLRKRNPSLMTEADLVKARELNPSFFQSPNTDSPLISSQIVGDQIETNVGINIPLEQNRKGKWAVEWESETLGNMPKKSFDTKEQALDCVNTRIEKHMNETYSEYSSPELKTFEGGAERERRQGNGARDRGGRQCRTKEEEAKAAAAVWSVRALVQSEMEGITPEEWADRALSGVEVGESLRRAAYDMTMWFQCWDGKRQRN